MAAPALRVFFVPAALILFSAGCLNNPTRPKPDEDDAGDDAADDARGGQDAPQTGDTGPVGPGRDAGPGEAGRDVDALLDARGEGGLVDSGTDGADGSPGCVAECAAGAKRCGTGGGLQSCTAGAAGCLVWSAESSCGDNATCAGTAPAAACACKAPPASCTQPGTFCKDPNTVATCAKDAQGCLYLQAAVTTCPTGQTCTGILPGAACGCPNTCTAAQVGTVCMDAKHVATCTNVSGCYALTETNLCPGAKTCAGPVGTATCACPAVGTTAGTSCSSLGATVCDGNAVLTCTADGGGTGCRIWTVTTDCATAAGGPFVCGTAGGASGCQCPDPSATQIFVDPVGGTDSGSPSPNGASDPPACRYKTLTKALGAVTGTRRRIVATTATLPATFAAETFPLMVPTGTTLGTAAVPPAPASYVIQFNNGTAGAAVVLASEAVLEGFTIDAATGNPAASAVSCSAGSVTLRSSVVAGAASGAAATKPAVGVAIGLGATDTCTGTLSNVTVRNFLVGVKVTTASPTAVTIGTSTLRDNGAGTAGAGLLIAGGTVTASGLTVNKSTGSTATAGVVLDASSPTVVPALTATELKVADTAGPGLELRARAGMAAPSATLTGGDIKGGVNAEVGVRVGAGSLSITGTNVHDSGSDGLRVTAGTVTIGSGAKFGRNGRDGVRVEAGTLTGTGFEATSNTGDGVSVTSGTVTLHRVTTESNRNRGLLVNGGTVVLDDGSIVRSNGTALSPWSGIRVFGGNLTVGGATGQVVNIDNNSDNGIKVTPAAAGSTVSITRTQIHGSARNGLEIDLPASSTVSVSDTDIYSNADGVTVFRAPGEGGNAGITLDNVRIRSHNGSAGAGGVGIALNGQNGDVVAVVKNCNIRENRDYGLLVQQGAGFTTSSTIDGNDIYTNNRGAGRAVGGVLFATASTLTSFTGNKIHANTGDELGFGDKPNGGDTWNLTGPACGAATNKLYCYTGSGASSVGLRILPTAPAGTSVDAQNVSWFNATPVKGVDFDFAAPLGFQVNAAPACPRMNTCN